MEEIKSPYEEKVPSTKGGNFFERAIAFLGNTYDKVNKFFKNGKFEAMCRKPETYFYPFLIIGTHFIIMLGRYFYCLAWIRPNVITWNPAYVIFAAGAPFIIWAMSTMCEKFDSHGMKRVLLWVCVINALFTVCEIPWFIMYRLLVTRIMTIRVAGSMTQGMVVNLARIALIVAVLIPFLIIFFPVKKSLTDEGVKKAVGDFKLNNVVDMRRDKEVAYDIHIMKEAEGLGKKLVLKQQDLFTHAMLLGPSGTGKTSTSITPMIIDILDRKCRNRIERQKRIDRMLVDKKAYISKTFLYKPDEYDVKPYPEYKEEFEQIYVDYPDAGITMVSPNDGIGDAVVDLCKVCNVDVQMVDPEKYYDDAIHMGLNPFFVPLGLGDIQRTVRIVTNARNFSEILISVNEAGGSGGGDQYFRDLNTSVTTNIAGTVMTYKALLGEQATLGDVKECINDFKALYEMAKLINERLALGLTIQNPDEVSNNLSKSSKTMQDLDASDVQKRKEEAKERQRREAERGASEEGIAGASTENIKKGIESYKRPLRDMVRYVNDELFVNGTKMYDQSRGLRNILNEMVSHPDVYDVLNVEEGYIDFDRNFDRCAITVVDTAVMLGKKASSALGLFYLLNFSDAVQRRYRDKKHPRLTQPHFLIVDEAAQYTHAFMSQSVSLFRQYKVACFYAFQSLLQMDANANFRDIKGSLLQVGNIITYGRLGEDEMKTFETLAGEKKVTQYQQSVSSSSLLADNASSSVGERTQEVVEAVSSKTDLRYKNFKEATWFRYVDGNVLPPLNVMLDFADMHFFDALHYEKTDYSDSAYDRFREDDIVEAEAVEEEPGTEKSATYDEEEKILTRAERYARKYGRPEKATNSIVREDNDSAEKRVELEKKGEPAYKMPEFGDYEELTEETMYEPKTDKMSVKRNDADSAQIHVPIAEGFDEIDPFEEPATVEAAQEGGEEDDFDPFL